MIKQNYVQILWTLHDEAKTAADEAYRAYDVAISTNAELRAWDEYQFLRQQHNIIYHLAKTAQQRIA